MHDTGNGLDIDKQIMRQEFLIKEDNSRLVLLFGGWGSGPEIFSDCRPGLGYDMLLCYDYRDLEFDYGLLNAYSEIRLVAWSMGVWVADAILGSSVSGQDMAGRISQAAAVGGTLHPVDDSFGIPEAVFKGTLDNLSDGSRADITLRKFRRRMCGDHMDYFSAHLPSRTTDELRDELAFLSRAVEGRPADERHLKWDFAVIGEKDMIFPAENQERAWKGLAGRVIRTASPHFDETLFSKLTEGEWIKTL